MLKINLKILDKNLNLTPPITHIINFMHLMPTDNYSAAQSGLNFSNKMHEHIDYTQSFVVQ